MKEKTQKRSTAKTPEPYKKPKKDGDTENVSSEVDDTEKMIEELLEIEKSYILSNRVEDMTFERIKRDSEDESLTDKKITDYADFIKKLEYWNSVRLEIYLMIGNNLPFHKDPKHYEWLSNVYQYSSNEAKFFSYRMKRRMKELD